MLAAWLVNVGFHRPQASTYPAGVSPFGCHNMFGNVAEFMAEGERDPSGTPEEAEALPAQFRGGSFLYAPTQADPRKFRSSDRSGRIYLGFRVARDGR